MFLKQELRKKMLERRRGLPQVVVEAGGVHLLETVQTGGYLTGVQTAFVYVGAKNEVSTLPLLSHLLKNGVRVCVPKTFSNGYMEAWEVKDLERDFSLGKFGILEPTTGVVVPVNEIDLAIVPGVVFDKKGNRIGYGGGYYDRFLQTGNAMKKIGVCYDFQMADTLETESTDIPMDAVIVV